MKIMSFAGCVVIGALAWGVLAIGVGLVVGRTIRSADEHELVYELLDMGDDDR
jgi:membrane protein DedA with SNARE-associated domain